MPRERVGPYRLIRRIGSGGMASVFEARDEMLGHRVAIKLLHPHIGEKAGAAERFLREGRATGRIRHPHVVQVHALGEDEGLPYLAMELLEGGDLAALLARDGRMAITRALDLLLPVIDAVAAAHDAGVIHRDLKPSNVFIAVGPQGKPWPKVVDFGISKLTIQSDAKDLTATDAIVGTAAYMAPEQARAVRNATFLSDQYALGVILYECVTGEQPFAGGSIYEILQAIMTAPVPPPSGRASGISAEFDAVVLRSMRRNAEERFATVRDFGAALLPFASERARLAWSAEQAAPSSREVASLETFAAHAPTVEASREGIGGTLAASTVRSAETAKPRGRRGMIIGIGALLVAAIVGAGARMRSRIESPEEPAPRVVVTDTGSAATSEPVAASAREGSIAPMPASSGPFAPPRPEAVVVPMRTASPRLVPAPSSCPRAPVASARPAPSTTASSAPVQVPLGDNKAPILP